MLRTPKIIIISLDVRAMTAAKPLFPILAPSSHTLFPLTNIEALFVCPNIHKCHRLLRSKYVITLRHFAFSCKAIIIIALQNAALIIACTMYKGIMSADRYTESSSCLDQHNHEFYGHVACGSIIKYSYLRLFLVDAASFLWISQLHQSSLYIIIVVEIIVCFVVVVMWYRAC